MFKTHMWKKSQNVLLNSYENGAVCFILKNIVQKNNNNNLTWRLKKINLFMQFSIRYLCELWKIRIFLCPEKKIWHFSSWWKRTQLSHRKHKWWAPFTKFKKSELDMNISQQYLDKQISNISIISFGQFLFTNIPKIIIYKWLIFT